jgi:uncharacterized protein YukE
MTGAIVFDSRSLDDLTDALAHASTSLTEVLRVLEADLAGLAWNGDAEQAYKSAHAQWTNVMDEMSAILTSAVSAAKASRSALVEAENSVASLWARS